MSLTYKFPLKMHVGAPCTPIALKGDKIERGQCIAEPQGLGAKIHSSISGDVLEVNESEIIIQGYENQSSDYIKIKECETILETIYEAGIVGAGGAGFPTHIKFSGNTENEYIIANCVECEPLLKHNIKLIEENPEIILKGIAYAMEAANAKKGIIAIKKKNRKAIESVKKVICKFENISIAELKDLYPMGEERAMIHAIFDKWLEATQLPLDAKCIVLNCETLSNITRAVEDGKPVIDKDITVAGKLNNEKKQEIFFQVPVGTPVKELIEKSGGIDGEYGEIVLGGPYTGISGDYENSIVTKTSGGVIVTIPLPEFKGKLGLVVCACGADEMRLRDIAEKMGATVTEAVKCKNIEVVRGVNKCKTPGTCPGQTIGVLQLKKSGAQRILISNCSDCSNTIMNSAPKMGLGVYHHTDHIFRTVDHELTRRLEIEE
jgi:proline reductase-associated electron transfer protein PrdC